MDKTYLHDLAIKVSEETGFVLDAEIYRGNYYSSNKIRNVIFKGAYRKKPAILKIYDDPRLTDEPISQIAFSRFNKSKIIKAPVVYRHKIISPQKGWIIMEKLPDGGSFFTQPVKDKKEFARLFLEYRANFPQHPTRPLTLAEHLSADEFHIFRISRWLELATAKEAEVVLSGGEGVLTPKEFMPRFEKALALIRKEFKNRKMIWCHGHFKPHELFKISDNSYYLTDFAHSKMHPEGYEFAFIIWADWMMSADWGMSYQNWKKGIDDWVKELEIIAKKLKIKSFHSLIRASLVERAIGTILADICASDIATKEKTKGIKMLYRLLDDIL